MGVVVICNCHSVQQLLSLTDSVVVAGTGPLC